MTLGRRGAAKWPRSGQQVSHSVPADGAGADEKLRQHIGTSPGVECGPECALPLAGPAGRRRWDHDQVSGARTAKRNTRPEAAAGGKDAGSRFFSRCLAKSRGSTPEQQQLWRDGIYEQIREVMPMQGGLKVERMCCG